MLDELTIRQLHAIHQRYNRLVDPESEAYPGLRRTARLSELYAGNHPSERGRGLKRLSAWMRFRDTSGRKTD